MPTPHRAQGRHGVTETVHTRGEGAIVLRLDGRIGVRGVRGRQPGAAERAGGSPDARPPPTSNRGSQPRAKCRCQHRSAESPHIGALRLISHCLLREIPTNGLVVLETREGSVGAW